MAYQPEIEKLERRYAEEPAKYFAQLAEAYRRGGRVEDALSMLRQHLEDRPNYVSALIVLGRCLLDQREDVEAGETFERVLSIDAENIIALKVLGEIAERGGDTARATEWLQRLLEVDPMNDEAQESLERLQAGPAAAEAPPAPAAEASAQEAEGDVSAVEAPPPEEPSQPTPAETIAEAPPAPTEELVVERASAEYHGTDTVEESVPYEGEVPPNLPAADEAGERTVELDRDLAETAPLEAIALPEDEQQVEPPAEPPVEPGVAAEAGAASDAEGELELAPFDDSLEWGTGQRLSGQISEEDLAEAEALHSEDVEPITEAIPGIEHTDMTEGAETTEIEAVSGFVSGQFAPPAEPVTPEPTIDVAPTAEEAVQEESAEEPAAMDMAPEEAFTPAESQAEGGVPPEPEPQAVEAVAEVEAEVIEEPVEPEEAPEAAEVPRGSLAGLPLILPEGVDAAEMDAPAEPAEAGGDEIAVEAEPEAEPVVTETMAEVYARQGLLEEAREVYRRLLEVRPGDARLAARLAELAEAESAQPAPAGAPGAYAAVEPGGLSARAYLVEILSARPTAGRSSTAPPPAASAAAEATPVSSPAPNPEPAPGTPMDAAFGEEGAAPRGAPTRPAPDQVSLASIFGESAPPPHGAPPPQPPQLPQATGGKEAGSSFDEFFGGQPSEGAPDASQGGSEADEGGDEDFHAWLKGLKT